MTDTAPPSTIVLIPGHWLGAWAWNEVIDHLTAVGVSAVAMTLPGLDPDDPERESRGVEDQVAGVLDLLAHEGVSSAAPALIVAHSGANVPVSVVLDRHPELVCRVVWVDSGPLPAHIDHAPDLEDETGSIPLPEWDVLGRQASTESLSPEALDTFRLRAVPQPAPVLRHRGQLTNDARRNVPTTLVCCSIPSSTVFRLADEGHPLFSEVAKLTDVDAVDLPTGHWPMWSRPHDLAQVIALAAARTD